MSAIASLPHRIAHEITALILTGDLAAEAKLSTQVLADRFAVSRTPVRDALALLATEGVVKLEPNRGYFVRPVSAKLRTKARRSTEPQREGPPAYYQLAEDWLHDAVPEHVTERFIAERYGLGKSELVDILTRATAAGWIERKAGYGWRLLPVAKTPEAQEQLYRMRLLLEPAAFLEPSFKLDRAVAEALRADLLRVQDGSYRDWPADRLHSLGVRFHETLLRMSGNPFLVQAVAGVNRMRRLLEYRSMIDRARFLEETSEHLGILKPLLAGDLVETSFVMRRHIGNALRRKTEGRLRGTDMNFVNDKTARQ